MPRTSKGKYSRQVFLGYDSEGKRIQKRIYSNSKKELDHLADIAKHPENAQNRKSATFGVYSKSWLSVTNKTISGATADAYERILNKDLSDLDRYPLSEITKMDCQNIINEHADAPQLCRKIKTILNQIFKSAMDDEYMIKNPAANLTLPRLNEVPRRALTKEEKIAIAEADLSDSDRIYMLCLLYFGLRPAEASALRKDDFTSDTVTVSKAMEYENSNAPKLKGTKTGTIRTLPIPSAFKELKPYLNTVDDFLFTDKNGNMLSKTSLRRKFARIKDVISPGTDLHPYVFRYNYATQLYYSGITIKKAAELMGHSSTAMIIKIYAQIDSEKEKISVLKTMDFLN